MFEDMFLRLPQKKEMDYKEEYRMKQEIRNKTVEEMFNISISANFASTNNYDTDALNAILAGDDAYGLNKPVILSITYISL